MDGGSTYLKAALIDEHKRVLRTGVTNTGIDNNGAAKRLLAKLMNNSGVSRIHYTMATGYSRKILEVADDDVSEITAHAYGVRVTAPREYRPGMIVDIQEFQHERQVRRRNGQIHGGHRADTRNDHRPSGTALS